MDLQFVHEDLEAKLQLLLSLRCDIASLARAHVVPPIGPLLLVPIDGHNIAAPIDLDAYSALGGTLVRAPATASDYNGCRTATSCYSSERRRGRRQH